MALSIQQQWTFDMLGGMADVMILKMKECPHGTQLESNNYYK